MNRLDARNTWWRFCRAIGTLLFGFLLIGQSIAQTFPSRPVRIGIVSATCSPTP